MEQKINIINSQNIPIIQAEGDVVYGAKGLLPKEQETKLYDGDERNFCFLSIDVVGHSTLSSQFSPANINDILMNLREWLNSIITKKWGSELNWAGDGGIFYFLQEKAEDRAIDNAVSSSFDILNTLSDFNNSKNSLFLQGNRNDIRLRLSMDFGPAIYRKDPGNWHSEALNTAAKINSYAAPKSVLITHNTYKNLTDSLRTSFKETSRRFNDQPLYIFFYERIIDPCYEKYFWGISELRKREFAYLDYWVNLYAIETKLVSLQEQDRGRKVMAVDLVNEYTSLGKNALIFGESGAGKTFTCLRLFEEFKKKYCTAASERIPIFTELSRTRNNALDRVIREGIEERFNQDKDKYIIFLDGLNEVGGREEQERIFGEIDRFGCLNPATRLFVTTQTPEVSYRESGGFELYEIQRFESQDVIEYLVKFGDKSCSKEEAERFYDSFPDLMKGLISIPVFLYILVSTYDKERPVKVNTPGELLQRFEDFVCGCGSRTPHRLALNSDYRQRLIPFLSFNMCKNNETTIQLERLNGYIDQYRQATRSYSLNEAEIRDEMTRRFNLMKEKETGFEFIHQRLRDYFAAVYMKNKDLKPQEILNLAYPDSARNDDLINATRLLSGIISADKAKALISGFIPKDPYLACEMFGWSSISGFDAEFIDQINNKIDIRSREYLLNLGEVISFYIKVLDLLEVDKRENESIYTDYLQRLGIAYRNKLDYDQAIKVFKKAIKIYEQNRMQNHPDYARCHVNLGLAYWYKLDYDGAIEAYQKAIGIYEQNQMQNHPEYAKCHINLGNAYWRKLDYDQAIEAYQKALKIYEQNQMQKYPEYALCHMNLGIIYSNKLDYDRAIKAYKKAIGIYEQNQMQDHPDYARCHVNLGLAYWDKSEYDQAIEVYQKSIGIYEQNRMQKHPDYAKCQMNLGLVYWSKLDYDQAIEAYKKAIGIYEQNRMQNHPEYARCQMNLGIAYWNKLEYDQAIEVYQKALKIYEQNRMQKHPDYALCHMNLGLAYDKIGKRKEAISSLELAMSIFKQSVVKEHPWYQECLRDLKEITEK